MIAIIDCGVGNLRSVQKAFESFGAKAFISGNPDDFDKADSVVLPGVGAYGDAIGTIKAKGLDAVIYDSIKKKPFLGICVGMQMLFNQSEESDILGLSDFAKGKVVRLPDSVKIPEIGWNTVDYARSDCPLFQGIPDHSRFYFAHSYCAAIDSMQKEMIAASTNYGIEYCSVVWKESHVFGVQFHPEKSGQYGLRVLRNFAGLKGV